MLCWFFVRVFVSGGYDVVVIWFVLCKLNYKDDLYVLCNVYKLIYN